MRITVASGAPTIARSARVSYIAGRALLTGQANISRRTHALFDLQREGQTRVLWHSRVQSDVGYDGLLHIRMECRSDGEVLDVGQDSEEVLSGGQC